MSATAWHGRRVETPRLGQHVWTAGPEDATPVLLLHGNLTTGAFWEYVAQSLPEDVRVLAPDLRGFGLTDPEPIHSEAGLGDMVDDVRALVETLGLADQRRVHAAGWSMGGGVLQQYLLAHPDDLASMTLVAPLSPYGFGGTRDVDGRPCSADAAGTGGGGVSPDLVRRLAEKDTGDDDPASSPRVVLTTFFGPRGNAEAVDLDALLDQLLTTRTGEDFYPGDMTTTASWPGFAPGRRGVLNAMAPCHFNTAAIVESPTRPPITWIHGTEDQVVSDASMFDLATLGRLGVVPGWPGEDVMPSQPMVAQTRAVLERYAAAGGVVREVPLDGVAHGIPLEAPERVAEEITRHLR